MITKLGACVASACLLLVVGAAQGTIDEQKPPSNKSVITEDSPGWNCLTMGNKKCGPKYKQVDDTSHPQTWIAMISDASPKQDPYHCLVAVADTTTIVCDSGLVVQS